MLYRPRTLCVLEYGSLDDSGRMALSFKKALNVFDRFRCKELLACFPTYSCGNMLDDVKLASVLDCISDCDMDDCLFHGRSTFSLSRLIFSSELSENITSNASLLLKQFY